MKFPTISTQRAKKEVSIVDYLASHGHYPIGKSGNRLSYKSPFREEKKASLFVDEVAGIWNDFGHGGGSIIDLVLHIHQEIQSVAEALEHLAVYINEPPKEKYVIPPQYQTITTPSSSSITNLQARPLNHFILLKYLREERGISEAIAKKYLQLLFYDNGNKKDLFGIGWQNDSGAWEIRSGGKHDFKAVTGTKDITTISGKLSTKKLFVFEGMLDFLSALMLKKSTTLNGKVIILNSTSMVKKIIPMVATADCETIYTFFDNDGAGVKALKTLKEGIPKKEIRQQTFYEPFNDVNEYLVHILKKNA